MASGEKRLGRFRSFPLVRTPFWAADQQEERANNRLNWGEWQHFGLFPILRELLVLLVLQRTDSTYIKEQGITKPRGISISLDTN